MFEDIFLQFNFGHEQSFSQSISQIIITAKNVTQGLIGNILIYFIVLAIFTNMPSLISIVTETVFRNISFLRNILCTRRARQWLTCKAIRQKIIVNVLYNILNLCNF